MALNDTTTWTGASNSDFSTAGNWTNGTPDTDGTAIIDGAVDITGGTPSVIDIARVYIASTYTGAIGSVGTPLELDFAELSVDNNSSGSTHYIQKEGTTNDATVMVDGSKTGNAVYLSGTIDKIIIEPTFVGTCHIGNGASGLACIPKDLVMLTSTGIVDASTAANVAWASSSQIDLLSGTLKLGENIGSGSTLNMSGGTLTVTGWTVTGTTDVLNQHGGTTNWTAGSTGVDTPTNTTMAFLNLYGGTFTTVSNVTAQVGFRNINQYGGTLNLQSSFANIEVTGTFTGYSGTYNPPKQSVTTTTAK